MGSLLGRIYSGLLHEVRLWVAIAEIGTDAIMAYKHLSLKPCMGYKVLQSTIAPELT